MKRRGLGWWAFGAAAVLALIALVLQQTGADAAGASTLARGAGGWLAARLYLEARGAEVALLDRPPGAAELRAGEVLVTTLPWQLSATTAELDALAAHAEGGGTLLLAVSPQGWPAQERLLARLGLEMEAVRGPAPLAPRAWRRHQAERWRLRPEPGLSDGAAELELPAGDLLPAAPADAGVLYRLEDGRPAVFALSRGSGEVVVLPAGALANATFSQPGAADLLESLHQWLGPRWAFDEYHHGLVAPEVAATTFSSLPVDLLTIHLVLLYLLTLLALGRRFGRPWREPPVTSGAATTFLHGVGGLHHRLGHHAAAARRLLARVRQLEPQLALPPELDRRAETADAAGLIRLAGEIAALRTERRP